MNPLAAALQRDGCCVARGVFDASMLERLRRLARRRIAAAEADHFARFPHHGSLLRLSIDDDPVGELLTHDALWAVFAQLGFTDPRWLTGHVIAKPAGSPGLWWHQDWCAWGHPYSYRARPTQVFCMIYLEPTSRRNGCLRVLPGSHLARHPLHDLLPPAHSTAMADQAQDSFSHLPVDSEIDILTRPGDVVICDVRVLHATHANRSAAWRTAIDLLFVPHFAALSDTFRAHFARQPGRPAAASRDDPTQALVASRLAAVLPGYSGPEPRSPLNLCRQPCWPAPAARPEV